MPQEESIPLLRGAFHSVNYNNNLNNRRRSFSYLKVGFIISVTLLLSVNFGFYFIESKQERIIEGVPKIPYEYYLGLKSDDWIGFDKFKYVIEMSPPVDPNFSNLLINEDSNSNFTEESSHDRLKIAEIVAKNYKAWNPTYYEVKEERYNSFDNYTVLTTRSYMTGLWFIMWSPKVHVSFESSSDYISENKDNNGGRKTRFDDQEGILKCDYEISWNHKYFGEIYRKCPNQRNWDKIVYVKGSSELGMQWLDLEGIETYGIVTKPAYGKNRQMRNVMIRPDSPFPPILPALYLAYFDQVIDRGDF